MIYIALMIQTIYSVSDDKVIKIRIHKVTGYKVLQLTFKIAPVILTIKKIPIFVQFVDYGFT